MNWEHAADLLTVASHDDFKIKLHYNSIHVIYKNAKLEMTLRKQFLKNIDG